MKKFLLIAFTVFVFNSVYAQQGELLYTEFNPYPSMTGLPSEQNITIDINHDGIDEMLLYREFGGHNGDPWQIRYCPTDNPDADKWKYRDVDYELTDTLSLFAHYGLSNSYTIYSYDYNYSSPSYDVTRTRRIGVQHAIDDPNGDTHYCYGWIEVVGRWTWDKPAWHMMLTVWVTRMAYCTIPDYPLRYGQTSLYESILETDEFLANIHPNPTTGIVTITGVDVAKVEVANVLGQSVFTNDCNGDVTIDLSEQPAGIYIFNITDKKGNQYAKKVIRE